MWQLGKNVAEHIWLDKDKMRQIRQKNEEMVKEHKRMVAKIKAFSIVTFIILYSTIGFYYVGYYNIVPIGHEDIFLTPTLGEHVMHYWLGGVLAHLIILIFGAILAFLLYGLTSLYHGLVEKFN